MNRRQGRRSPWCGALVALGGVASAGCPSSGSRSLDAIPLTVAAPDLLDGGEVVFDGATKPSWQESGSVVRDSTGPGPAKIHFGTGGQWVFARTGLKGTFSALVFRVKEPPGEAEFLEVALGSNDGRAFPAVKLKPDDCTALGEGWTQVVVPMSELNPKGAAFDRIEFRPFRPFGVDAVYFDRIGLAAGSSGRGLAAAQNGAPAPLGAAQVASAATGGKTLRTHVQCEAKAAKISPLIYGVAYGDKTWPALSAAARRWGGNASSRYNFELHVANRANDWFFENRPELHYDQYLAENAEQHVQTALTVPMIGWVSKDGSSYSFPVSSFGAQQKTDPWKADAGNGVSPSGTNLPPSSPERTSVAAPPEWVKRWVETIRAADAKTKRRSVDEYILDNEPMLWNTTHRDVHPEPLGYDELLDRTLKYGAAVRMGDPDAVIAGPAEWGWSGYFFSSRDLDPHGGGHADRRAHGDVPLIEWYLQRLREHEQKTGVRILDVLDVHYYPQGANVYGGGAGGSDRTTQLLRLRSTRSLWDPTYVDESWIHEAVRLLPRMHEWVDKNYPGRGISLGEWNFGGEHDVTGALATAEALGRFAQFGVTSAFYWTTPAASSPSAFGFLAYRNFDGHGSHFLDWYVPTTPAEDASFFASRDSDGTRFVIVAINLSPDDAVAADIDMTGCGSITKAQSYAYTQGSTGLTAAPSTTAAGAGIHSALAPWSITVIAVDLRKTP